MPQSTRTGWPRAAGSRVRDHRTPCACPYTADVRWVPVGAAAIVGWDVLVAVAWSALHFGSEATFLVDLTIYFGTAFQTAREMGTARAGAFAGAVVAVAGQTAAFAVTLLIGPGLSPMPSDPAVVFAFVLTSAAGFGAIVGLVAGLIARR